MASVEKYIQIRESGQDRIFLFCVYFFLSSILILVLYPIIYILSSSFSSAAAVQDGKVWLWPVNPTLDGYMASSRRGMDWIFKFHHLYGRWNRSKRSLTIMMAYPLSRKEMVGRM